ncbi:CAAX amino terminal protease family protein [Trifolium pratense]|uniref:CAAX amino terminal protease family protein n=1 Tax=Trifolium pratense TaxID=57577 RepID=A0A2K3PR00_TRIPR|nr:CAAX amino terminal protease family protein [Trifolium pratense]
MSVTGWLQPAYVKIYPQLVSLVVTTPFYRQINSNSSLKCSPPQLQLRSKRCYCKRKEQDTPFSSALQEEDSPWESGDVWSNFALYLFTLHIPLSFCGLSVFSLLTGQQQLLHPQTQAISLLTIQVLEFNAALVLLKSTAKPQYKLSNFFKNNDRNWFLSSALGFGFIVLMICLTSLLADRLFDFKPISNPILKEILLNSDISRVSCVAAYCIVTPLLEEVVYRGFLLTSLSSTMKWQNAVVTSSLIFSASHFSGENFVQLFIIGDTDLQGLSLTPRFSTSSHFTRFPPHLTQLSISLGVPVQDLNAALNHDSTVISRALLLSHNNNSFCIHLNSHPLNLESLNRLHHFKLPQSLRKNRLIRPIYELSHSRNATPIPNRKISHKLQRPSS